MSAKFQTIIVTLSILILAIMIGCASFQEALTPCWISPAVIKYVNDANLPMLPVFKPLLPYTSLFDARIYDARMDLVHLSNQAKENLQYNFLKGVHNFHMAGSVELKESIFSSTGAIGILFPALAGTSIGAFLIPRSKDVRKKKKLEEELVELKAKNGNSST